ncbi:hypothetical protein BSL78_26725 [Apostichopus japonicus]|uniref:DUF7041 domain-containing protein n=1 Tax=Stichopus japonicus TaxID=307972 RepID=A0A2G8JL30_STIJA|nr:hypothetical protein BSL78_26725 [Apostichopus japonicus]
MATPDETATTMSKPEPPQESSITAVNLRLPPFYPNDPALWFGQVESLFVTRRITSQDTKFAFVISSLQPEVAQEIRDILLTPPSKNRYDFLKSELIKRTSQSEQKRLRQLLTTEDLGDRKPSQLLRRMYQLLGDQQLESSILKQLFLQRLPTNVQLILASTSEQVDIHGLASLADKILEVTPSPVVAAVVDSVPAIAATPQVAQTSISPDTTHLVALVDKLSLQVEELTRTVQQLKQRSRSRSRPRGRSPAGNPSFCYFHNSFGDNARKCRPPCKHPKSQDLLNKQASN